MKAKQQPKTAWLKPLELHNKSSQGSVTMEYIIVSSFALIVSMSAVTWIGKVIKERVEKMATKVGSEAGDFNIDWDSDQ